MAKILNAAKLPEKVKSFVIFVDSNAIHTNEKDITLFSSAFIEWWNHLAKDNDVILVVPELVYSELHQQKTKFYKDKYRKALDDINSINKKFDLNQIEGDRLLDDIKDKIGKKLFSQLKKMPACHIEQIPYADITAERLKTITEDAIWRNPPFKYNHEGEGFRDAIILETLRVYRTKNAHKDIVFLSNDYALDTAARKLFSTEKNLIIFKEYMAAGSYIDAARTKFSAEFLHAVINKAETILNPLDATAFGKELTSQMEKDFSLEIGSIEYIKGGGLSALYPKEYVCDGNSRFHGGKSNFVSVVGEDRFHWRTYIAIFCDYSARKRYALAGEKTTLESLWSSNGETEQKYVRGIFLTLEWGAKVNKNEEFSDFRVISIAKNEEYFKTHDDFYKPTLTEVETIS